MDGLSPAEAWEQAEPITELSPEEAWEAATPKGAAIRAVTYAGELAPEMAKSALQGLVGDNLRFAIGAQQRRNIKEEVEKSTFRGQPSMAEQLHMREWVLAQEGTPSVEVLNAETIRFREQERDKSVQNLQTLIARLPKPAEREDLFGKAMVGASRFLGSMGISAVNPAFGTAMVFTQMTGMFYEQYRKEGVPVDRSWEAATINALLQTPLEQAGNLLQIGFLKYTVKAFHAKGIGVRRVVEFLDLLWKSALAEGLEEFLQTYPEEIANMYAARPEMKPDEIVKDVLGRAGEIARTQGVEAFKLGAIGGAGLMGMAGTVQAPFSLASYRSEKTFEKDMKTFETEFPEELKKGVEKGFITPEEVGVIGATLPEHMRERIAGKLEEVKKVTPLEKILAPEKKVTPEVIPEEEKVEAKPIAEVLEKAKKAEVVPEIPPKEEVPAKVEKPPVTEKPSVVPERVIGAAFKMKDGSVVSGKDYNIDALIHYNLYGAMSGTKRAEIAGEGFITDKGRYLTRAEAGEFVGGLGAKTLDAFDIVGKRGKKELPVEKAPPVEREQPGVTLEKLKATPALADYVLKRPGIHEKEVIEEARRIKGEVVPGPKPERIQQLKEAKKRAKTKAAKIRAEKELAAYQAEVGMAPGGAREVLIGKEEEIEEEAEAKFAATIMDDSEAWENVTWMSDFVTDTLKKVGASKEVLEKFERQVVPAIKYREEWAKRSLEEHAELGEVKRKKPVGLTLFFKNGRILMQLASDFPTFERFEKTVYHEYYHVAERILFNDKELGSLQEFEPNSEIRARAFADYAQNKLAHPEHPGWVRKLYLKLRRFLQILNNGFSGRGFMRLEDSFGRLMTGVLKVQPEYVIRRRIKEEQEKLQVKKFYKTPKEKFVGKFPETASEKIQTAYFQRRRSWTENMNKALSEGKITLEEAQQLGYVTTDQWKTLPKDLYHTTTARTLVEKEGLKTRKEIRAEKGEPAGLGGGPEETISFTTDPEIAKAVQRGILEAHSILSGKVSVKQLIRQAQDGKNAKRSWWQDVVRYYNEKWKQGDPLPLALQEVIDIVEYKFVTMPHLRSEMKGWQPVTPQQAITMGYKKGKVLTTSYIGGDGQERYFLFKRPLNQADFRERLFSVYNTWAWMREHAGGPMYPLFFGADANAIAELNPKEVRVLRFEPKERAIGIEAPGMREWRVYSGDAVILRTSLPSIKSEQQLELVEAGVRHTFSNPDIEERVSAAQVYTGPTLWQKISDIATILKNRASREYEHLSKTEYFSQLRFDLLKLAKQKGVISPKVLTDIKDITADLTQDEYHNFTRAILINDAVEDITLADKEKRPARIPFGLTRKEVDVEKSATDALVAASPKIQEAIKKRQAKWKDLRTKYIAAMKEIGFNVETRFKRKNYYRHVIMDYVDAAGIYGTGKRLKGPVGRSYLKGRLGSEKDIWANYIMVEHEIMAQMLYDVEIAQTLAAVDKNYNLLDDYKRAANEANFREVVDALEKYASVLDVPEGQKRPTGLDLYRQLGTKMAIGFDNLGRLAAAGELPLGERGEYATLVDALAQNWQQNAEVKREAGKEWTADMRKPLPEPHVGQVLKYANYVLKQREIPTGKGAAATIFKGIAERRQSVKEILGDRYVTWKDMVERDPNVRIFQPIPGNIFYNVHTVPEQIAQELLEGALKSIELTPEQVRKVTALGGKHKELVVAKEIADALSNVTPMKSEAWAWHKKLLNKWKIWQLVMPRRFFKYNFRNLSGDADGVFAGNPTSFRKVGRAIRDLLAAARNKEISEDLRDWIDRGGQGTLLQAQEIGEWDELVRFGDNILSTEKDLKSLPKRVWHKYWKIARLSTDIREAVLRYANYLEYLDQMRADPNGMPNNFGASIREEILGLQNIKDRAFWLANDLLGAYDRISVVGQTIREHQIPFWSWKEVNFVRYKRLLQNAIQDKRGMEVIGRRVAGTVVIRSPFIAWRLGKMAVRATALWSALIVWNNLFFGDEEDDLPEDVRNRPHVLIPNPARLLKGEWTAKDDNGELMFFSRLGALADLLEWAALDTAPETLVDIFRGKTTIKEYVIEMAKAPINTIVQGGEPFLKVGVELLSRRAMFPDVFKQRTVRDRTRHLARSFGLENEYDLLMESFGKPMPGRHYYQSVDKVFYYTADPFESAYYDMFETKRRFMKSIGKFGEGFWLTPKGSALYNCRAALRYGDDEAMFYYMNQYFSLGGTKQGLKQSLNNLHPLAGMNEQDKKLFVATLDAEELDKLVKSLVYYAQLRTGINAREVWESKTKAKEEPRPKPTGLTVPVGKSARIRSFTKKEAKKLSK